jgi:uncharacterized repeat protein (TIGR01451 family)
MMGYRRRPIHCKSSRHTRRPGCEVMERRVLLSNFTVTSVNDSAAPNTLRWAILQVDSDNQPGSIRFNIAGGGVQTIHLSQPLPALTNSVVIDGTSQPNYAGIPLIQLDGSALGQGVSGLVLTSGSSTIEGLSIVGFSGSGVVLNSANSNLVAANYLGISATGGQARGNGIGISIFGSSNNTIGGSSPGSANVISGNTGDGISIDAGGGSATANEVFGNLIGTNPAGTLAVGNGQRGIVVVAASGTGIGSALAGAGNVISGNAGAGVALLSGTTGTVIQNNEIGLASDAKTRLGNQGDGIYLSDSPSNQIGGTDQHQGNFIGANQGNGVNAAGTSSQLLVEGNWIGTDVSGSLNLGNQGNGISLASSSNTIGGTIGGAANTIDYNGVGKSGSGVQLVGNPNDNEILSNSIYQNAVLGINLGSGPTPNHAPGTPGPNNYQNYPTLLSSVSDGTTTTIAGSLNSLPNTKFLLQFFASPSSSLSGFGQGKLLIGSDVELTNAAGLVNFTFPISAATAPGQYVSATATDPAGNTSEFALDVPTQGQINLVLSGGYSPAPVVSGGQVTYALTVTNQGSTSADDVVLSNQLPGGVTFLSATVSQGFVQLTMGSNQIGELGTIAPGRTATMTIVGQTGANTPIGTIVDTATVTSQEPDPTPADESVSINTTVVTSADLAVQISVGASSVQAGSNLTYTITATNTGPQTAHNVSVILPIVAGEAFVSTNSPNSSFSGGQVLANLGDLAVNAGASFQVVVKTTAAGSLSETATVSSDSLDPVSSNNTSTVVTEVDPAADVQVAISSSDDPVITGKDFRYTVTITNAGPSGATSVVVSDTLPSGVAFLSAGSDQGVTPTYSAGVVTLSLPTLAAGVTATMTIELNPTAAPGSTLTDKVSVTHQEVDPNPDNDSATLMTAVRGTSDLGVTATSQQASAYVGQNISYLLSVSNQGPNDEPDAVVSWPIPGDASFVSANSPQGSGTSIIQGVANVDVGPLASGKTVALTLVAMPLPGATGQFTTAFSVQGENLDSNSANNTASASVQVSAAADLSVTIEPGVGGPNDGLNWTYTISVSNLGLSDATGVTVYSPVPSSLGNPSVTASQGSQGLFQNGIVSAALGAIPAGQTATVTIAVLPTAVGSYSLTASVAGDQYDPDPSNNEVSVPVSTSASANLSVSLVPPSTGVESGQNWSFTAWVQNEGPDPATNVVLTIPMASGLVFESAAPSKGTMSQSGGQLVAKLGQIDPGTSASVTVSVMAPAPGTITQTASAVSAENQLNPDTLVASTTVSVLESAGILQFTASAYSVSEFAGLAQLVVTRTNGARGAVSVGYQTVSAGATAGLDYAAASGTLSFASGQTSATIQVPVLADPWDNHDEYVNVVLGSPAGGATIGPLGTSLLRIIDVDPNYTPPEVAGLSWTGSSRSITSLNVMFTAPLNRASALNQANYQLFAPGLGNRVIALTPQSVSNSNESVTLVPSVPLPSGQYYYIQIVGSGPTAIRDIAGNFLDGSGLGQAGTDYKASFAQATRLQYLDASGNKVSLKLAGSGYMEQVRDASGEGVLLQLVGVKPHHATLSGTVKGGVTRAVKRTRSARSTDLGTIAGLGNFGDVKVLLTSPPFFVKSYPFQRRGKGVF